MSGPRLKAALRGNLRKMMCEEAREGKRAVRAGIKRATDNLKNEMRRQTRVVRLGRRLANSWRGDVYPKGRSSFNAAGHVYTKAPKIFIPFERGSIIKSSDGFFLAIPTSNAPKSIGGKRTTPALLERARGINLRFVYRPGKPSLLVLDNQQAVRNLKTGGIRGFRNASKRNLASGSRLTTVVMFILVPQVRMKKLIDLERPAKREHNRIPGYIVREWSSPNGW